MTLVLFYSLLFHILFGHFKIGKSIQSAQFSSYVFLWSFETSNYKFTFWNTCKSALHPELILNFHIYFLNFFSYIYLLYLLNVAFNYCDVISLTNTINFQELFHEQFLFLWIQSCFCSWLQYPLLTLRALIILSLKFYSVYRIFVFV